MIPSIPWYLTLTVIVGAVAVALAAWSVVSSAVGRSGLSAEKRRDVQIAAAGFLAAWLGLALALAPSPASVAGHGRYFITPLIPLFALGSIAAFALAYWRSSSLRAALAEVPSSRLHLFHVWRILGVMFLILLARGELPAHFALPAGWGDIAIGLSAPWMALALTRRRPGVRALATAWNVLGLLDLVVAIGMGTGVLASLLSPGTAPVSPAAAMGVFPMFLVPAFLVPLAMLIHGLGFAALRREARWGPRLVGGHGGDSGIEEMSPQAQHRAAG